MKLTPTHCKVQEDSFADESSRRLQAASFPTEQHFFAVSQPPAATRARGACQRAPPPPASPPACPPPRSPGGAAPPAEESPGAPERARWLQPPAEGRRGRGPAPQGGPAPRLSPAA